MEVWLGGIACLSSELSQGGVGVSRLFVGIDVSKEYSTAQGIDKGGKKLFFVRFAMNAEGFSELRKAITNL